ncbi:MAG: Ig-like domain-containing protein, partial [Cardiobacteriaceae bacterium]|nr:Ig-like domain-containing protein [Cardiobacteriaceae bacterium]
PVTPAPVPPTPITVSASINALPTINKNLSQNTVEISGTLSVSSNVTSSEVIVSLNGTEYTADTDGNTWKIRLQGSALAHAEGSQMLSIQVEATDGTQTKTYNTNAHYLVDTIIEKPVITLNPLFGDNVMDYVESQQEFQTITGSVLHANAGETLVLTVGSKTYSTTLSDTLTFSIDVPSREIAQANSISVSVATQDSAGNQETGEKSEDYTVNLTPPVTTPPVPPAPTPAEPSALTLTTGQARGSAIFPTPFTNPLNKNIFSNSSNYQNVSDNGFTYQGMRVDTSRSGEIVQNLSGQQVTSQVNRMRAVANIGTDPSVDGGKTIASIVMVGAENAPILGDVGLGYSAGDVTASFNNVSSRYSDPTTPKIATYLGSSQYIKTGESAIEQGDATVVFDVAAKKAKEAAFTGASYDVRYNENQLKGNNPDGTLGGKPSFSSTDGNMNGYFYGAKGEAVGGVFKDGNRGVGSFIAVDEALGNSVRVDNSY